MKIQRTFHAIGHGGFYSEQFMVEDINVKDINIVYDCGSVGAKKVLDRKIDEYKKRITDSKQVIDLLCISHFDRDHINGIERLCKGIKVENILLPYIYNEHKAIRLLLYAADILDIDSDEDRDIIQMMVSPNEYFRKIVEGEVNIIQLNGSSNREYFSNINIEEDSNEVNLEMFEKIDITSMHDIINKPTQLFFGALKDFWCFIPFNYRYDELNKQILDNVNDLLKKNSQCENDFVWLVDNFKIIKKDLKKIYEDLLPLEIEKSTTSIINAGSMILYSGPNSESDCKININRSKSKISINTEGGFLYCGDYNFNNNDMRTDFLKYCHNFKKLIGGLQLPHHGSTNNYETNICQMASFSIASVNSCDPKHPAREVAIDAAINGLFFPITEDEKTEVVEDIELNEKLQQGDKLIISLEKLIPQNRKIDFIDLLLNENKCKQYGIAHPVLFDIDDEIGIDYNTAKSIGLVINNTFKNPFDGQYKIIKFSSQEKSNIIKMISSEFSIAIDDIKKIVKK
ncbi:MAG TPA: hypothetical protein VJ083_02455 [Sedimentibacter sp.]|nr:hypothetical protein [Sedimentibacter sp.]